MSPSSTSEDVLPSPDTREVAVGYEDLLAVVSTDIAPSSSDLHKAISGVRGGGGLDQGYTWRGSVSSPLHEAARRGHAEAVRILVEVGGMRLLLRERNGKGEDRTALYEAVDVGGGQRNAEVVRMLLYLGADVYYRFEAGLSELGFQKLVDLAREKGDECVLGILLEYKENRDICEAAYKDKTKVALQDVIAKEEVMEAEMERASDIQSKIETNEEAIRVEEEMIREVEERIRNRRLKIEELKTDKEFMTPIQKKLRMREMDEIGVAHRRMMASVSTADNGYDESVVCPTCHKIPAKAFSCVDCSHFLCEDCRRKASACPRCGVDFSRKRPQRNVAAERLILASLEKKRKTK